MIFSLIALTAVSSVRETLADKIPSCDASDGSLGCRFLAELQKLQDERIDKSVVHVNIAEFALLLKATRSCGDGDSMSDCQFWENWGSEIFNHADTNGDGILDTQEKLVFTESFEHELNIDGEISEKENMLGIPAGTVSRADFVDGFKAQMLAEAFLAADLDGDFVISLNEMEAIAGGNDAALVSSTTDDKTGNSWLEQLDVKELAAALAALPTAHLYSVLFPKVHGNNSILGIDGHRRRLFWFLACVWLCTMAAVSTIKVADGLVKAGKCEFSEHTRLGSLERRQGRCN